MEIISRLVATFLVNALWQVALVAAAAALAARLMRSAPARFLHGVWLAALALSLALPVASLRVAAGANSNISRDAIRGVQEILLAPNGTPNMPPAEESRTGSPTLTAVSAASHSPASGQPFRIPALAISAALSRYVALGFLLFMLLRVGRFVVVWRRTLAVARRALSQPQSSWAAELAERSRRAFGVGPVSILSSGEIRSPLTLGARQPVIVLPEGFLERAGPDELASALSHEMAHLARRDYLFNLVAEVIYLPLAFHPAANLIRRRINETREVACDELAAGRLVPASTYARSLVAIAEALAVATQTSQPNYSLGVFDANNLEDRIMRLLHPGPRAGARFAKALLVAGSLLMGVAFVAAASFPLSVVQTAEAPQKVNLRSFAGNWSAKFEGQTYVVVTLKQKGDALGGSVSLGNFGVDDDGQVNRVQDEPNPDYAMPITDVRQEGEVLRVTARARSGKVNLFEMKLAGSDEAQIKWSPSASSSEGPMPGWWTITRAPAKAENEEMPGGPSGGVIGGIPVSLETLVGRWRGIFHDQPFVTLALRLDDNRLTGTMSSFFFRSDQDGNLVEAEGIDEIGWNIVDAKVEGSVLHLKCQGLARTGVGTVNESASKSGDTDEFELKLTGSNEGELKPLGAPFPVKPWKMTRESHDAGGTLEPEGVAAGVVGGVQSGVPGGVPGQTRRIEGVVEGRVSGTVAGLSGKEETSKLTGTVSDPSGGRIAHAVVSLIRQAGSFEWMGATDENGEFACDQVPQGSYRLVVKYPMFERAEGTVKVPGAEKEVHINVMMSPANLMESAIVRAKRPGAGAKPPVTTAPKRIVVGGQVEHAKLIYKPQPEYPESARSRSIEGTVVLEALISIEGLPLSLKIIQSPDEALSKAAIDAVKQWRYKPTTLNGAPVEVETDITVKFSLEN